MGGGKAITRIFNFAISFSLAPSPSSQKRLTHTRNISSKSSFLEWDAVWKAGGQYYYYLFLAFILLSIITENINTRTHVTSIPNPSFLEWDAMREEGREAERKGESSLNTFKHTGGDQTKAKVQLVGGGGGCGSVFVGVSIRGVSYWERDRACRKPPNQRRVM